MSKNVIFPDTKEFDQKLAPEMKAKMDAILGPLGLNSVAIGSAHTPTPGEMSGDMDLQVDLDEVKAKFKTNDDKDARKALAAFVQQIVLRKRVSRKTFYFDNLLIPIKV